MLKFLAKVANLLSAYIVNLLSVVSTPISIVSYPCLLYRCFQLCSSYSNFHIELVKVKDIFKTNGYPISFIDRFLDKLHTPKIKITTVEKKQLLIVLPYLGVVSDKIRSSLYKILSKHLPCCKLNIVWPPADCLVVFNLRTVLVKISFLALFINTPAQS